jgi:DNA-binding transcriptional MerR regulator
MAKEPEAFLTIGEMAQKLGVRTHILRYWEEQFPMLQPLKRAGGRRLYRPTDVALLEHIQDLLENQGFTIRGARQFLQTSQPLKTKVAEPAMPVQVSTLLPNIVHDLRAVRMRLTNALNAA